MNFILSPYYRSNLIYYNLYNAEKDGSVKFAQGTCLFIFFLAFSLQIKQSHRFKCQCSNCNVLVKSINLYFVKSVRIRSYSGLYSVRMRENTDQNNSEHGHFLRSVVTYFLSNFFGYVVILAILYYRNIERTIFAAVLRNQSDSSSKKVGHACAEITRRFIIFERKFLTLGKISL